MNDGHARPAIVLDASVAIARLRLQEASPLVFASLEGWVRDELRLLVPSVFWLEVLNALAKKHRYDGEDLVEAVYELQRIGIATIPFDEPQMWMTIHMQDLHGLTSYDASYLALAETTDARLATLDRELASAAGPRAVYLGRDPAPGHRISDARAPYGREAAWPRWRFAASYLADLRRRVAVGEG
jgi:predicted nucleic acid-binding protein